MNDKTVKHIVLSSCSTSPAPAFIMLLRLTGGPWLILPAVLHLTGLVQGVSAAGTCRSQPGDADFPTAEEWSALNVSVNGQLISVTPSAKYCEELPCTDAQWSSSVFRATIPGAMDCVSVICTLMWRRGVYITNTVFVVRSIIGSRCVDRLNEKNYFIESWCRITAVIPLVSRARPCVAKGMFRSMQSTRPPPRMCKCETFQS